VGEGGGEGGGGDELPLRDLTSRESEGRWTSAMGWEWYDQGLTVLLWLECIGVSIDESVSDWARRKKQSRADDTQEDAHMPFTSGASGSG
jgi:hypothetical protein